MNNPDTTPTEPTDDTTDEPAEVERDEPDLLACEECTQIIANGEIRDGRDDEGASIAELQVKVHGANAVHLVLAGGDDEGPAEDAYLQERRCDACGRYVMGEFHAVALIPPGREDAGPPAGAPSATCRFCGRTVHEVAGAWLDFEATGDDFIWREHCGDNDTERAAPHEPTEKEN